jgi:hypothetical protein
MEPQTLSYSYDPDTGLYPEPDESSPQLSFHPISLVFIFLYLGSLQKIRTSPSPSLTFRNLEDYPLSAIRPQPEDIVNRSDCSDDQWMRKNMECSVHDIWDDIPTDNWRR